jgi:hypothetical protein
MLQDLVKDLGHKKPAEYSKNDDYVLLELLDACAFLK